MSLRLNGDMDDFTSAGMIGLIQAARRFDASRGLSFSTYAIRRIRGSILDDFRSTDMITKHERRSAFHGKRALPHRRQYYDQKVIARQRDTVDRVGDALRRRLARSLVLRIQDRRTRSIVEQYYFEDRSALDIATDLQITESRVCQLLGEARKQMLEDVVMFGHDVTTVL